MQRKCGQFIRGKTHEEKFRSIEKTLASYSKRLSTKVIGLIPPIPIFKDIDSPSEDGTVVRAIFPLSGVISRTCMLVEYKDDKSVTFSLTSQGPKAGNSITFETKKKLIVEDDVNLNVGVGDVLVLKVDEPERVGRVLVGILFEVSTMDMNTMEVPLDRVIELMESEEQDVVLEQATEG